MLASVFCVFGVFMWIYFHVNSFDFLMFGICCRPMQHRKHTRNKQTSQNPNISIITDRSDLYNILKYQTNQTNTASTS